MEALIVLGILIGFGLWLRHAQRDLTAKAMAMREERRRQNANNPRP